MKRRDFLKTLSVVPVVGLMPTFVLSEQNVVLSSTNNSVVGLNKIVTIIQNDKRLNRRVSADDIADAIGCVQRMNEILIEAVVQTGVANDKHISMADTRELNDYIFHNYHDEWVELHGDDSDNEETGFHKVVNDGASTKLFGVNAINRVADGIYHLGFESHLKNRLLNEDANANASYKKVAIWLDALLREDLEAGRLENLDVHEVVGDTDSGLDKVIDIIYNDTGLQKRISTGDMREGAKSANAMNGLLLEAIDAVGAGNTGSFTINDIKLVNKYLVANSADEWVKWHGDDENNEETGYHKVQSDGATTKLYDKNAINKVFDGIYHLGFATTYKNNLMNEDGAKNVTFSNVTAWLNELLSDDLTNQQEDLKILIPLYSYPNWWDASNYVWQKILDVKQHYPDAQITAIVNPSNGHFREQNSDYVKGIQDLMGANIKLIGYVYTLYGNRAIDEVIDDIEAWKQYYKALGVSGIFFDEVSTNSLKLSHYSQLSSEARNRGFDFVVLNPGITTDKAYIESGIADVVVSYENENNALLTNPPANYNVPTQSTELSLLIHTMESNNVNELITFAREHQFAYIYFTEDGLDGNPWDSISEYFEDEVIKMRV
jgi:hypothetical protein